MNTDDLALLLRGYTYHFTCETELQDAVEQVLVQQNIAHTREALLDGLDRIDFLVGDVGIEIKIDGSLSSVTRQVHRYLQCERVSGIVLLSGRLTHTRVPMTMNGKPVRTVWNAAL